MDDTQKVPSPSLGRLGAIWLISLFGVLLASYGIGWFDRSTELTPSHGDVMSMCFLGGALVGVVSAGVAVWQSAKLPIFRRVVAAFLFALIGFMGVFLFLSETANIIEGIIDFPPGKTQSSREHLLISRAYQTHEKGRSWNIQTMPIWSNLDITQDDYKFMLAHRRPGDDGRDPDEISSDGYFCARVTIQVSGDAIRVMHAGRHTLPKGTVVLCPTSAGDSTHD